MYEEKEKPDGFHEANYHRFHEGRKDVRVQHMCTRVPITVFLTLWEAARWILLNLPLRG